MFHVKHLKINIKNTKMKHTVFLILIIGLFFVSCNQNEQTSAIEEVQTENLQVNEEVSKDEIEIRDLIRKVLKWADAKENSFYILPVFTDEEDSIYVGFDMKELEGNLNVLKKTGFFAKEFIENYNQIIRTLDKKMRSKEYDEWLVGDLPTFGFSNDENAWCSCQDYPYDEGDPNAWNVEIKIIRLNNENGDLEWTWDKSTWADFKYKFKVVKENNKWKISYMEGFNFEEGVKWWNE